MASRQDIPNQSVSRYFRGASNVDMATGDDMLQRMVIFNERSTSSNFIEPVELSHQNQVPYESLSPTASRTLKRSHWKPSSKAEKCSDPKCQTKFSALTGNSRKRNCCMCGEVFCRNCTKFRRKLSLDATPDPFLGTLCHVCKSCFDSEVQELGNSLSWTQRFEHFRHKKLSTNKKTKESLTVMPIPALEKNIQLKRERILQEMDRLTIGFEMNAGWMKSLLSDVKIPSWQRSQHWVESSKSHQCQKCHQPFKMMSKKVNCRVCGQVYCGSCTKEEIILFINNDEGCKWAINGKTGTPTVKPRSYTLLPVCDMCTGELANILVDELESEEELDLEEEDFMESLSKLQSSLYRIKARIELRLPQYQKLVDSMDVVGGAPRTVHSKNPIYDLAHSQFNLSDHFSQLAVESQALRKLSPLTPLQCKLLKNMIIGTCNFYNENMYLFRMARNRLSELMPIESLEMIQRALNIRSIERVHLLIRQITFEAMNLEIGHKMVISEITSPLVECVELLEDEVERYFNEVGENWQKHSRAVSQLIREDFEGTNSEGKKCRRLKVPSRAKKTPFRHIILKYKILLQCSHYLSETLRELDAKTPDNCFVNTKSTIKSVQENFDKQVALMFSSHPQVFNSEK